MGAIPIVLDTPMNAMFAELPVMMVRSWGEVTPESLERVAADMARRSAEFRFDKLYMAYWAALVEKASQGSGPGTG